MVNQNPSSFKFWILCLFTCCPCSDGPSTTFMQVTHQIYVAEEWAKNSREEVNAEIQSHRVAKKAVEVLRQEKESLAEKIKEAIQAQDSAKAGLKTTER